jgi:hypothetical protein
MKETDDSISVKYCLIDPPFNLTEFAEKPVVFTEAKFSSRSDAVTFINNSLLKNAKILATELNSFVSFEVDRYNIELKDAPKSAICLDVVRFDESDFYLVGAVRFSVSTENDDYSILPTSLSPSLFYPVRSKIVEYLALYQATLYEKLKTRGIVESNYFSSKGLNHFLMQPIEDIKNEEEVLISLYAKNLRLDAEELEQSKKWAEEKGLTLLQFLKSAWDGLAEVYEAGEIVFK